jgi:hypothetical protein
MKRQELGNISHVAWSNVGKMDYLFGLPVKDEWVKKIVSVYPNLTKGQSLWNIRENIITSDPHPFDSMDIKVRVTPKQSKKLQKKAFAMGYYWGADCLNIRNEDAKYLFFQSMEGASSLFPAKQINYDCDETYFNEDSNIELTYKQFMNGSVPKKKFKIGDHVEIIAQYHSHGFKIGTIGKVTGRGPNEGYKVHDGVLGYYVDFNDIKHTTKPLKQPLTFKGHKVIKNIHSYDIGCANITHDDINAFLRVCDKANGEATPNEIAEFARKHHK